MSCEGWTAIRLGDVCTKIGSGATPRGGGEVYLTEGPYTLIRSQNIYNDGFHRVGLAYIGEEHAAELSNVEVRPDDVLLNITGDSVARCCQVDNSVLPARVNQHVAIVRPDQQKLNARFLRYFLISPEMQAKLLSWAGSGGTRNALTKGMIESFEIPAPREVKEQEAIGAVLGALDEKIALNRRTSGMLEGVAQALFKSWFVDFDPVRAKANRGTTTLPDYLVSLFPNSFQDSALGEIPTGWKPSVVGDFGDVVCGKTPPTSDATNYGNDMPFVTIPDMHGKVFVTETNKSLSSKGAATQANKTLPRLAVCVSCIATVGLVALTSGSCQTNQQINSVIPTDPTNSLYCYFALRERSKEIQSRGSGGSVLLNLNKSQFSALPILIPPGPILTEYQRIAKPMFDKILLHEQENQSLALVRDTILPKLILGEVRIPDAERIVGAQL